MSLENDDRSSPYKATETSSQTQKRSKISYSRDFLLSLSELEISRTLPSGFDKSILSEFEDALYSNQDWQRIQGSLTSQGFRRTDYSSSPPTRGDSGNYSRGIYRWDSRSSARSDRESDSQSDKDSDSGRRYSNQSRRSWQGPQHDGLLGSGSFPRPSGFAAGVSATKVQTNDSYQLNRSNEPYHPPRPYKAAPLSRRDGHDSYNDETFGSTESMSEDRVEEEKRRRASFELMRKEQQKSLQEKQKTKLEKLTTDSVSDISTRLDDNKVEKKALDRNNESDMAPGGSVSSIDSGKSALPSQTPTFRPLVPPGFTNMAQEKNSGPKSLDHSHSAEVTEIEECHLLASAQNGALGGTLKLPSDGTSVSGQQPDGKIMHMPASDKGDWIAKSSSTSDGSSKKVGLEELLNQGSNLPKVHESSDESEMIDLNSKVAGLKLGDEFKENDTTSILEKIFGNSLTVNGSNSVVPTEHHDNIPDERRSSDTAHSSKFAHWFLEEERKADDNLSSSRPNDLLSLIVGSDKSKTSVSDMNGTGDLQPQFPHQSSERTDQSTTSILSATNGASEPLQNSSKGDIVQNILTCEDLEQTILSEYTEMSSNSQPTLKGLNISGAKSEKLRAPVDDQASQHLLSLLQKGTSHENTKQKIHADADTSENSPSSDVYNIGASLYKTSDDDAQNIKNSGKNLTLETLFGTAFMKELQSVEAPVSVQRGTVGSAHTDTLGSQGLAFPAKDNGIFPSTIDHITSEKTSDAKNLLGSNSRQQLMLDRAQKWLENDDPQVDFNLSKNHPVVASKHGGFDGAVDYQLPEEESLIVASDNFNPQLTKFLASSNSRKNETLSSNASGDIAEKLAAMGAAITVERSTLDSDGPPFVRGPYNQIERGIHHDLHAQTSSPYFHLQQAGHGRPLLQPLDPRPAHMTSQLKFVSPERMIHQDASGNHQFPANMLRPPFHHPNVSVANFELPGHRPMLQQMQMPGNYSPQLVNEFPGGTSVPHLRTQASGIMQEHNSVPGYPFGPLQPNIGGLGMPIPAPDTNFGANHPEAFQRLLHMERRANSKQMPPFTGHSQGTYGHELDFMRFR